MYCPKCGRESADDAQICSACSSILTQGKASGGNVTVKTSRLAIAALVLGILSIFTCGLTAIPAIILGIVSLVLIDKSGGRLTGRGFAITGAAIPAVLILLIVILLPFLARPRSIAFRMVCGTNLKGIGTAMLIYANDYEDELPRAGGPTTKWGPTPNWMANNHSEAFGMAGYGSGGQASISSSLYFLVKYTELTTKSFICKGDVGAAEFQPSKYNAGDKELIDLWDFGPEPSKHCSYSYHLPYSKYALTTSNEPGMAVAADRNPWMPRPGEKARDFSKFDPSQTAPMEAQKQSNTTTHQDDGQNVLFMDGHVNFEKRAYCAIDDDNIYTYWDGEDKQKGIAPVLGSEPKDRLDSLLVQDVRN